jgi:hypothetical protein
VVSFEEWDKQRRKKEEKAEKARKKAKKAEEDKRREERRRAKASSSTDDVANSNDDGSDDDVLTEKELAALRGYKKTSDGRTTSYFTREQTERERELIGSIAPRRLDESSTSPSPTSNLVGVEVGSGGGGGGSGPSAWNASGTTWEEKDATDWCTKTLERCLLDTPPSAHYSDTSLTTYLASVRGVSDVKGDASVAIAGGKKRYIYDYHATVEYEISNEGGEIAASGSLRLPEVHSANTSSGNEEELEVEVLAWKKAPSSSSLPQDDDIVMSNMERDCIECRKALVADVRKSVLGFVEKFNENF